jgi:GNAT superfamily N-acetyltransferase
MARRDPVQSDDEFTLRAIRPDDGPAIAALGEQTPETGAVSMHSEFRFDPYATLLALRPGTTGVVAEAAGEPGIAGLGLMSFEECLFEDSIRPSAYLYSLSVHPSHRRRGLGKRLATWRIDAARDRMGEDGVVFAGIQAENVGSLRTAESWSRQRFNRMGVVVAKVRSSPPRIPQGLDIRPAEAGDLEQIADRRDAFHRDHNFYQPRSPEALARWLSETALGIQIHGYHVVIDRRGDLVAGCGVIDEGRILAARIVRVAPPLRLANVLLRIIPKDGLMRRSVAEGVWFREDRPEAVTLLWEWLRWLNRDRASIVMTFMDLRSPVRRVIRQPRWMPSSPGTIVVAGPVPMLPDRLIYAAP